MRETVARIIAGEPQTSTSWSDHAPYRVTTSARVPRSAPEVPSFFRTTAITSSQVLL